jgi:hypothetical protein
MALMALAPDLKLVDTELRDVDFKRKHDCNADYCLAKKA